MRSASHPSFVPFVQSVFAYLRTRSPRFIAFPQSRRETRRMRTIPIADGVDSSQVMEGITMRFSSNIRRNMNAQRDEKCGEE
ncbi:hypothetical protein A0H81_06339 [Grifola frondosa]|uniref:Uncharacterized protein n=1 Tax=Grifola frondosa TaxID=5627 RepID=A0A1C7MC47_GRIFR|nr:hypothetical protein A0H81_06339 [Grifola frondosa]